MHYQGHLKFVHQERGIVLVCFYFATDEWNTIRGCHISYQTLRLRDGRDLERYNR